LPTSPAPSASFASRVHPDRHPGADDAIRRAMQQRFAALSAAYHSLIG